MKNLVLEVDYKLLQEKSEHYFRKSCGFGDSYFQGNSKKEMEEEAFAVRDKYMNQLPLKVVFSVCDASEVPGASKLLKENAVFARVANDMAPYILVYGMCIESLDEGSFDMLESFYLDTWMTSILDAGRDWLRDHLTQFMTKEMNQNIYLTDSFGPGFYGIGVEEIPEILKLIDGRSIGLSYVNGSLHPAKSNVGYYMTCYKPIGFSTRDCKNCLADQKNCMFCKNYIG